MRVEEEVLGGSWKGGVLLKERQSLLSDQRLPAVGLPLEPGLKAACRR